MPDGPKLTESDLQSQVHAAAAMSKAKSAQKPSAPPPVPASETAPAKPSMMIDLTNKMLGEFRLLRRLGRGGMSEVYLAEQTSLKRNVAIKIMRPELLKDEIHLKRFRQEAMAAGGLVHPNIVQVYTVGDEAGTHFIAQEYVQGQNLREYLVRKGPPDLAVALHIMKQVCAALQTAADAGVVHRDIKPENIMLTRKGEVKVADFGLAQLTQAGKRVNLTQVGVTMGTPLYMSPEQVNGSKIDHRSDIYSFGVSCYHMLTGSPPFRGETALAVAMQHLNQEPDGLEALRPDLPPVLARIVHKMMAKDKELRYQSAQAVLSDLKRVTRDGSKSSLEAEEDTPNLAITQPNSSVVAPVKKSRPKQQTWRDRLWNLPQQSVWSQARLFIPLAIVLGGLGAGIGWWRRPPNPFEAPARDRSHVPKKETAAQQFLHAMQNSGDEAAWQAVIKNHPDSQLERHRAEEKLALLYVGQGRYIDALDLFATLAGLTAEKDQTWRAIGLAGKGVVLSLQGQEATSQDLLEAQVKPLVKYLDREMRRQVRSAIARNEKKLDRNLNESWSALLDERP
ncbi:MAG: serine/threonine protein kinase [Planctomycetales bacterium]|nr:serine/threonine protein kinase [Planctomycetales bacterium]